MRKEIMADDEDEEASDAIPSQDSAEVPVPTAEAAPSVPQSS